MKRKNDGSYGAINMAIKDDLVQKLSVRIEMESTDGYQIDPELAAQISDNWGVPIASLYVSGPAPGGDMVIATTVDSDLVWHTPRHTVSGTSPTRY